MAGNFHILDCNETAVVVCGIPIEGGYGEDTFIEIEQTSADFETVVGADGDVTRSKTNDRRATVRLTLLETAVANGLLSALNNIDRRAGNGAGVGPLLIKRGDGTALYAAEKSWIAQPPQVTMAKGAEARVWEIAVASLERFDGGS
jgi:hypothetical protein